MPPTENQVLAWCTAVAWTSGVVSSGTGRVSRRYRSSAHSAASATVSGTGTVDHAGGVDRAVVQQRALVPEHTLRQAGGAARVPQQQVVARAFDPRERLVGCEHVVVGDRSGDRWRGSSVVDLDEHPELGQSIAYRRDPLTERPVEHEHFGIRVLEERGELSGLVPEVHVRRQRTQLRACEGALHVLGAVEEEERDVRAGRDSLGRESGRQAGGVVFEFAPSDAPFALYDGGRIGDGVGDRLPHGCETLVHGVRPYRSRLSETCS